jgi:uncharacterized membrane protein YfhO
MYPPAICKPGSGTHNTYTCTQGKEEFVHMKRQKFTRIHKLPEHTTNCNYKYNYNIKVQFSLTKAFEYPK